MRLKYFFIRDGMVWMNWVGIRMPVKDLSVVDLAGWWRALPKSQQRREVQRMSSECETERDRIDWRAEYLQVSHDRLVETLSRSIPIRREETPLDYRARLGRIASNLRGRSVTDAIQT